MSTTMYVFVEKKEKYKYFMDENSALSGAMIQYALENFFLNFKILVQHPVCLQNMSSTNL